MVQTCVAPFPVSAPAPARTWAACRGGNGIGERRATEASDSVPMTPIGAWSLAPAARMASAPVAQKPRSSQPIDAAAEDDDAPVAHGLAMEHDSQEIRVCALVLSVLAFFLFIAAEIVPRERTVVVTLVALGTLGFAWIGPLTLLAGSIKSPKFKWWQPFQGGAEFVWMQAFGWSLHTLVLTGAVVMLANNNRLDTKWMEGQYLLMGVAGFIAQLLLNLSIGIFNEDDVHDRDGNMDRDKEPAFTQKKFPWNAKAIVSVLVSVSGALLFVMFDLFAQRLQSTVIIIAGCTEFIISALMIHVFYGCKEIPGYRMWQPFEGERTFLLLQYLGWQFLAGTIIGTMMLCAGTDFNASPAVSKGAPTAVGAMGLISQIILLLSLHHFTPSSTSSEDPAIQRDVRHSQELLRRPPEVYVSGLLCFGALIVGFVSYVCRLPVESTSTLAVWRDVYLVHEKIFWTIGIFALALASPMAHLGAARAYAEYTWWQPFIGGTKFVFLQTVGWLWYGFFSAASIVLWLNNASFAEVAAPFALFLGSSATGAIVTSLGHFEPTSLLPAGQCTSTSRSLTPSRLPTKNASLHLTTRRSALQHGEIAISLMVTLSSIMCHSFADYFCTNATNQISPTHNSSLRILALLLATALFTLGCFVSHGSGRRLFDQYKFWQPFEGGPQFVVRQAVGWTLFAVELLFDALIMSVPPDSLPYGIVTCIGVFGMIPHIGIVSSIRYFKPTMKSSPTTESTAKRAIFQQSVTPTVSPRIHASPKCITWRQLLQRPDLRTFFFVNAFVSVGALALFTAGHLFHGSARFRHADEVLYGFGFVGAVGGIIFAHVGLGPRINPAYKSFQPFQGGLRFITFQGVGWTLASVAWVASCTALYWRHVFFRFQAIHLLTGVVFFIAHCILVHSLPLFKPPQTEIASSCPELLRVHLAKLEHFTHEFFVGPLLGMAACAVFVLVDLSMIYWGPTLPVFPITVCAVVALFSAIPMSYKFAQSGMGLQAKAIGGSVVFLVLGSALWSFTILLGALFCIHVWGMEGRSHTSLNPMLPPASNMTFPTNFMGTFTGAIGFIAQIVFFRASGERPYVENGAIILSPRSGGASAARVAARQAKEHLISASIWVYSSAAVATGFGFAYMTSFKAPRQLSSHQLMGMALCSLAVIGCAYWIQRQILLPTATQNLLQDCKDHQHAHFILSDAAIVQLESNAFAHVAAFLTVAELIRLSSTCKSFDYFHDVVFWRKQFVSRFPLSGLGLEASSSAGTPMSLDDPTFALPFASSWMTLFENRMLNAVCRLQLLPFVCSEEDLVSPVLYRRYEGHRRHIAWRTMCISKETNCSCEQCEICGKLEILTESSRDWEGSQGCPLRVPSTWVRLCRCPNFTSMSFRVAHRRCLERVDVGLGFCRTCNEGPVASQRYPQTLQELLSLTWTDFRTGRDDFAGGFFSFVPMAVLLVVASARSFQFGCCSLYVWVGYAMAICFVSNTPRINQSLERIGGDESSPKYISYQRLINALTLPSLAHVLWSLATTPLGVLDVLLGVNFALLIAFASALLLLFWRSSYRVNTFEPCLTVATTTALQRLTSEQPDSNITEDHSCIACLLELCSHDRHAP